MNLSRTTLNNQELNQIMVQAKFEKDHLKPPDGAACFITIQCKALKLMPAITNFTNGNVFILQQKLQKPQRKR